MILFESMPIQTTVQETHQTNIDSSDLRIQKESPTIEDFDQLLRTLPEYKSGDFNSYCRCYPYLDKDSRQKLLDIIKPEYKKFNSCLCGFKDYGLVEYVIDQLKPILYFEKLISKPGADLKSELSFLLEDASAGIDKNEVLLEYVKRFVEFFNNKDRYFQKVTGNLLNIKPDLLDFEKMDFTGTWGWVIDKISRSRIAVFDGNNRISYKFPEKIS